MECIWEYLVNHSVDATMTVGDNYVTGSIAEILLQSLKKPNPRSIVLRIANAKSQGEYLLVGIVTYRCEQYTPVFTLHVSCIDTNNGATVAEPLNGSRNAMNRYKNLFSMPVSKFITRLGFVSLNMCK